MSENKRGSQGPKAPPRKRATKARRDEPTDGTPERSSNDEMEADTVPSENEMNVESLQSEVTETVSTAPEGERSEPPRSAPLAPRPEQPKNKPADEYAIHTFFERSGRHFVATVLEFPELRATGQTRDAVLSEMERKLDQHLANVKRRNETLPEPVSARRYPDRLDLPVSQGLYRKLDVMSRQEKVTLDHLIVELLTTGLEKRHEPAQPPQPQHHHNNNNNRNQERRSHNNNNNNNNNQRHSQGQGQGHRRQGQGRNYHDTMDNRENFMEYVRNLEKGNLRKK